MLIALLLSISIIDLAVHRIPNKLIALVPFLSPHGISLNIWMLLMAGIFSTLPGVGSGDKKFLVIASLVISRYEPVSLFFSSAIGILLAYVYARPGLHGRIALAPAISLAIAAQI